MKLELKITMADPAGNRTAFVEGQVPLEYYALVGRILLADPQLKAEQVGFVCQATTKDAVGRLQMMGGEFCGNAARSFGLFMGARLKKVTGDIVPVEISGSSTILNTELEEGGAWISMPLPKQIIGMFVENTNRTYKYPLIIFEGIVHLILENMSPSEELAKELIKQVVTKTDAAAVGVMFLKEDFITPVVWVRDTESLIWESSCGSGTLATVLWLGNKLKDGSYSRELKQPGGILKINFKVLKGEIIEAKLGGPVVIEPELLKVVEI